MRPDWQSRRLRPAHTGSRIFRTRRSCSSANEAYSGTLIRRDTPLAIKALDIRLSTSAWPVTISITMMKDVSGACVTAARKPAMPSAIRVGALTYEVSWAMSLPSAPPMAKAGANKPPGTPAQVVSQVATNFSST